jgi:hypothetical protein
VETTIYYKDPDSSIISYVSYEKKEPKKKFEDAIQNHIQFGTDSTFIPESALDAALVQGSMIDQSLETIKE